eukprot:5756959-Amphidinium_carterae.6
MPGKKKLEPQIGGEAKKMKLQKAAAPCADTAWALYSAEAGVSNGKKPLGDACAACYETAVFFCPWKAWETVAEEYQKDNSFKATFDQACAYREQEALPKKDSVVEGLVSVQVQIQREFRVASENDLKRGTGLGRVPARSLKFLPVLTVPKEDGQGMETLYAFADETEQFRKGVVTVSMSTELTKSHLPAGYTLNKDHTQDYIDHVRDRMNENNGVKQLLDKQAYLPSYSTWVAKKLGDGIEKEESQTYGEKVATTSEVLEGPAALAASAEVEHQAFAAATPPSNLKRSPSGCFSASSGGAPPALGGAVLMRPNSLESLFQAASVAGSSHHERTLVAASGPGQGSRQSGISSEDTAALLEEGHM